MRLGIRTDSGRVRQNNQDACGHRSSLYLVADGMGGYHGGELASRLALEAILSAYEGREPVSELRRGFEQANSSIRSHAAANAEYEGMGTTVAALVIMDDHINLAHIGDSRIYRYRSGLLTLLTRDHSLVEELVRQGTLRADEAKNHPQRSILTRALGTTESPGVEYAEAELAKDDIFLLCTDGLTSEVEDSEIGAILAEPIEPQNKADRLVDLANQKGGPDNITVIVIENHDH